MQANEQLSGQATGNLSLGTEVSVEMANRQKVRMSPNAVAIERWLPHWVPKWQAMRSGHDDQHD